MNETDLGIEEPILFSFKRIYYKFRRESIRYKTEISIENSCPVWVNGPFACDAWPDNKIFLSKVQQCFCKNEKIVSDRGYNHEQCVTTDDVQYDNGILNSRVRARHKTCNKRFKRFGILRKLCQHNVELHRV